MNTYKVQHNIFNMATILIYILTAMVMLGISTSAPEYLNILRRVIEVYIGGFLLYRFHPFRQNNNFTELDRKIAFSAGGFIIMTTVLGTFINTYLVKTKNHAKQSTLTR